MKHAFFIALLACSSFAFAGEFKWDDKWTGKDKAQHAVSEMAIGAVTGMLIEDKKTAFAVSMLPGIAKELYDYRHSDRHTASAQDLAADALGAAIGVYVGNCIIRNQSVACGWKF